MKFNKKYIIKHISYVTETFYGCDYTFIIFNDGNLKCQIMASTKAINEFRDRTIEDIVEYINNYYDENKNNGNFEIYKRKEKIEKIIKRK